MFISLEKKHGGKVTLGDNTSCQVLGTGTIRITDSISIEKVLFVDGLKHSLLSISQLYDKGFRVCFTHEKCLIDQELRAVTVTVLTNTTEVQSFIE